MINIYAFIEFWLSSTLPYSNFQCPLPTTSESCSVINILAHHSHPCTVMTDDPACHLLRMVLERPSSNNISQSAGNGLTHARQSTEAHLEQWVTSYGMSGGIEESLIKDERTITDPSHFQGAIEGLMEGGVLFGGYGICSPWRSPFPRVLWSPPRWNESGTALPVDNVNVM